MTTRLCLLLIVLIVAACGDQKSKSMLNAENSDLEIGKVVGRKKLLAHQSDTFQLNVGEKALVFGYVDQHDVDLVVKVLDPDNKQIASFDEPARGHENFKVTTNVSGIHKIVVTPFEDQTGEYSILLSGAELLAADPEQRVEQIIRSTIGDEGKTPGVSIAVQRDGKIIFSKGYGYSDLEQNVKITPATIFHVASVSKQFTSFAIAMLADQGKLSLDDDIRKYLPEIHDFGTPITISHLAHHTSGLRDQWSLLTMAGWRMDDVITTNQVIRLMSRQTELNFKPGAEYVYCNSGFTLMAEIVHRVTKEPFPEWCKKNMFDPLGMKNTLFFDDHERIVENRAYSYRLGPDGYKKAVLSYANAGATSLFTTVEDIALWAVNFEKVTVGNANVMNMMNQKFILTNGDTSNYALGQSIDKYKGLNSYSHSGGDAGFRTYLLRFPEQHLSIAVFANSGVVNVGNLTYQLADLYLEKDLIPEKEKATPPANTPPVQPEFDASSVKLAEFEGTFYSPELETTYRFVVENDTLVSHHQRHDDMKLKATKTDGFNINILGNLDFYRTNGKVAGFKASNGRVRNLVFVKRQPQ